ncbi:MAG: lytic murein transglycosylase [Micavibrio aeruginosavorus]|uniref:Lytic murein transglycosylase n=1 Tax=Micavibrio aeruginosavorus TaxID=349221 RepID=A0A2W5N516_9BACT|nr:MAG: lytic murein transglycosylase [Micavibrio aeruginosavorus]
MRLISRLSFLFLCVAAATTSAHAQTTTKDFAAWLKEFRVEARQSGISQATIDATLTNLQPLPKVIALDQKQPEKKITFSQYKKNVVNPDRIAKGRALLSQHWNELKWVEEKTCVAPQYVVALWGIETNFGTNTGGFKVIDSLATLAWEGRRASFFKSELLKALKIIDEGHITPAAMKGSWAGAMGQNQFMPSSFFNFAVDANGDGHKDIWNTRIDVFASTANYLHKSGWACGQRWGRRVSLPANFPADQIGPKITKPLSHWKNMGIKDSSGAALPSDDMKASVVAPDGIGGEAYIVYGNYQTIMSWNRSTYFATSVGLLADALAK